MRTALLFLLAAALCAEAPAPDLQRFDQLLASSKFKDAGRMIDEQIKLRTPVDGKPRPDSVLNSMMGRLFLAVHQDDAAAIYLNHAPLAELPPSIRAATALDHGQVLELGGDRAGALQAYREAAAAASMDAERRQAALGIARQLLADNPAGARDQVGAIAGGPPASDRWQASYLAALANSLLGEEAAAKRAADQAWSDAASAPLKDLAPLHVATLRAGLAAMDHDDGTERAMLTTTNGLSLFAAPILSGQLPVCGDDGVRPSDFVTFGFVAGPFVTRQLVPIGASRPAIVATFQDALAGTVPIKEGNGRKPIGTVFTVACRSMVASSRVPTDRGQDPVLEWFVERGIYPASFSNDAEDEHLEAVAERIDLLAARFGKDSVLLTEPRWQTMNMLTARARSGDPVLPGQITDLATQLSTGMIAAGAPEWMSATIQSQTDAKQQWAKASDETEQAAITESLFRDQLRQLPVKLAYGFMEEMLGGLPDEWPGSAARLVLDFNPRVLPILTGRQRQAWLLTVARAQRALGKDAEARKTTAAAGLEKDLCASNDALPELLDQHFSYTDYPESFIAGEQEGAVLYEFSLTPTGSVTSPRVLYSLPSNLFDQPSAKGLSTVRYTVPTRQGKAAACRAIYQPIVWRLEDESDFSVPSSMPDIGPTT